MKKIIILFGLLIVFSGLVYSLGENLALSSIGSSAESNHTPDTSNFPRYANDNAWSSGNYFAGNKPNAEVVYLAINLTTPTASNKTSWVSHWASADYEPTDYQIKGSIDSTDGIDGTWVVLDTTTGNSDWQTNVTNEFSNAIAYKWYKMEVTKWNNGIDTDATGWIVVEFGVWNQSSTVDDSVITNLRNTSTTGTKTNIEWDCEPECYYNLTLYNNSIRNDAYRFYSIKNTTSALAHNPYITDLTATTQYYINLSVFNLLEAETKNNSVSFTTSILLSPTKCWRYYSSVGNPFFNICKNDTIYAPDIHASYFSSDGTEGYTGSCASGTTLTVKNGLITGCS